MSKLYSFILEHRGGTYFSQYRGRTPREALRRWWRVEQGVFAGAWRKGEATRVFGALAADAPVALSGLRHAWCCSTTVGKKFALLTIVETVP